MREPEGRARAAQYMARNAAGRPRSRALPLEVADVMEERLTEWVPVSAVRLSEVDGKWEMVFRDPVTTLVPTTALEAIEEVLQAGQEEHGDRWKRRSVAHHVGKAMGHARRALGRSPIDADSGLPHLSLAATRMILALAVAIDRANAEIAGRRSC